MVRYLQAIWRCRYFWLSLVKMDLRTRYRRSVLGLGWSLLQPIAMTVIICLVFQHLMEPEGGVIEYAPYLLAGLATWNYILCSTLQGCQCFFLGEAYIRQHPAPLAIYPLRTALAGMIHFLIALAVVVLMVWALKREFANVLVLWTLVPNLCLLFLFAWSLAILAGFANVYFQDTQHLAEVGFQVLFYISPILYKATLLERAGLGWLAHCNPLAAMLDLIRQPVVYGNVPTLQSTTLAAATVLVLAGGAVLTLARCQKTLIFRL
jgi:ABC-type polysaccharide/polyol phosphate export permease